MGAIGIDGMQGLTRARQWIIKPNSILNSTNLPAKCFDLAYKAIGHKRALQCR
jgi:hypothetical protein